MTNDSAVFGVSAVVEHLFYCSTYILLLVMPRYEASTLEVAPTCDNLECIRLIYKPGNYLILVNTVKL